MAKIEGEKLEELLAQHPDWHISDGKLMREWSFSDFKAAMAFVNGVAEAAEAANHHPDIDIRYNKVILGLISHNEGGITGRDARMAAHLDKRLG